MMMMIMTSMRKGWTHSAITRQYHHCAQRYTIKTTAMGHTHYQLHTYRTQMRSTLAATSRGTQSPASSTFSSSSSSAARSPIKPSSSSSSLFSLSNLILVAVSVGCVYLIFYVHESQSRAQEQMHKAVIKDKQRLKERERQARRTEAHSQ